MFGLVSRSVRRVAGAVTVGLAVTAGLTVAIHSSLSSIGTTGTAAASTALTQSAAATVTGVFPMLARNADGRLYDYEAKGTGGFKAKTDLGGGYSGATAIVQANVSDSGGGNDLYFRMGGTLYYTAERGGDTKVIGSGWDQFNLLLSVGNIAGSAYPDLLARDTAGAIWLYQGKVDGTLAAKVRAGASGWNGMDQLAGRGDYTGDGKGDLLARATTGTLYLYPGTGNATTDTVLGSRFTVGTGWNTYNALVSTGDNDGDGKADLIARDTAGALWLFKGTGTSSAPFAARVQIGASGWNQYNALF